VASLTRRPAVFLFGERRFVAAAPRFFAPEVFGDRLLVATDAGFVPLVRFFAAPIAAPETAPSTAPTTGGPRALPATAPATAPPNVLFAVPETASPLLRSSLSLSSMSLSLSDRHYPHRDPALGENLMEKLERGTDFSNRLSNRCYLIEPMKGEK
jgi:hypothetical protein